MIFICRDELTTKEICKKLGHPLLIADTEDILRRYKEKFSKNLTQEQKTYADFTRNVYPAAAFFVAAHKNKVRITQAAIANSLDIQKPELQKVIASIQMTLEPPLPTPEKKLEQKPIVISDSLKRKLDETDGNGIKDDKSIEGEDGSKSVFDKDSIPTSEPPPPSIPVPSNESKEDPDDNYMAFRKIAEDLGLHCDKEEGGDGEKGKKAKAKSSPPLKKPRKLVQTTLKF